MAQNRVLPASTEFWLGTAVVAFSTVLMLDLIRVFTSHLVFYVNPISALDRAEITVAALIVFVSPVVAGLIVDRFGLPHTVRWSATVLAVASLLLQFTDAVEPRLILGALGIICWGWTKVALLVSKRQEVAFGIAIGLALETAIRIAFGVMGLQWMPDVSTLIVTSLISIGLVATVWKLNVSGITINASLLDALPVLVIGPAIALYYLIFGNVTLLEVQADISFTGATLVLSLGFGLGITITAIRLAALSSGPMASMALSRFLLLDIAIGTFGLIILWSSAEIKLLGLLFIVVTSVELFTFALLPPETSTVPKKAHSTAIWFAVGMVVQFIVLFLYYSASGSWFFTGLAWALLVLGASFNVYRVTRNVQSQIWPVRSLVLPVAIILLVLASATALQYATWSAEASTEEIGDSLTIATYNVHTGFSNNIEFDLVAIAETIEAADPDVVVLEEISRNWAVMSGNDLILWFSDRLKMPYVWGPASTDDLWGNAILSKAPMSNETLIKYQAADRLKRALVSVELETPMGQVLMIGTHLAFPDNAEAVRLEQSDELLEYWAGRPHTIIAGDFNATPDSPVISNIINAGFVDTGAELGPDAVTTPDGRRIDYIFTTPDLTLTDVQIIDNDASDHFLVFATFEVSQ